MPAKKSTATAAHPAEGFRSVVLPSVPGRPVRVYLPTDYQPHYAYPLVVLFHADGECEEHSARLVPLLSRRNYVALCVRGPVPRGPRADGRPSFGWGAKPDRAVKAALAHATANFNVRPDRIFLLGASEGAGAAYRFAMSQPGRVAGVVSLNGELPPELPANDLRVLIAHGSANPVVPVAAARRTASRLSASGADVRFSRYATTRRVHAEMLRDANRWIMTHVTGKLDAE